MLQKATCFSSLSWDPFSGHIVITAIFSLHIVSTVLVLAHDGSVTCDVLPVEPMKNTILTCHFPEDVSQTRRDFTVQLLKEKESQEPEDVVDCWWMSGKMDCYLWPGYRYNMTISDKLSLEILKASTTKTGLYTCRLADMDPKLIKTCEFKINLAGRTMCEIPSVDLHSETSLTCYFPEDISQTKANFAVYHHYSQAVAADAVVSCEWKGENLYCNTLRGYLFDHSVTDHLTVRVPSVTEINEGSYSCQIKDGRRVIYDTCSFALQTGTASVCSASSVKEMEPATLTCRFNTDVNVTRRHFRVVRLGAIGTKDTNVAVCVWVEDQLDCSTAPGYEVNGVVSHQLIVSMPRAASEQNGTYACYLLGSRPDNFEPCEFIVTTDSHGDSFRPVAIGVPVTLIPLTLITVMAVLLFKRRSRKSHENEGTEEEKVELISRSIADLLTAEELCRCLGTTDPADVTAVRLWSDQLSDPKTPWDVSSDVLRELGNWWQRRVAVSGPDSHVTSAVYKTLVAWFCSTATTVTVPCTSPPPLCVKTLGQTVSWTGECYTAQITLFPEQVDLLNTANPSVFVSGPPGTGKTVVLLLKGIEWLRCGNDVHIVSIWFGSRAACVMLYHLLLHVVKTQLTSVASPRQLHLLQHDFDDDKNMDKAVSDLSQAASGGSLYVIADEAGPETPDYLQTFCDKLMTQVPRVHLLAASCYDRKPPAGWQVEYLTRPLRSPPAVIREVQQDEYFSRRRVAPYSESDVSEGPPVKRLCHLQGQGHSGVRPQDCSACGSEVASFLYSLRGGVSEDTATTSSSPTSTSGGTTQPSLQWRDVLVLPGYKATDKSGAVKALREADIPVRVTTDDDIEDVATARSDVVWVAERDHVRGLERKVVVCLGPVESKHPRLHVLSRCSAWLVIVSPEG